MLFRNSSPIKIHYLLVSLGTYKVSSKAWTFNPLLQIIIHLLHNFLYLEFILMMNNIFIKFMVKLVIKHHATLFFVICSIKITKVIKFHPLLQLQILLVQEMLKVIMIGFLTLVLVTILFSDSSNVPHLLYIIIMKEFL